MRQKTPEKKPKELPPTSGNPIATKPQSSNPKDQQNPELSPHQNQTPTYPSNKPKHRTHIQKHIPNTPDISQTCETQCNISQTHVKYANTWRSVKKMSATDL
ncbi:hypothetical protein M758_9G139900 [Ceratodon purpureus]|nr:hypothetical protein M758_9G139900 [Ceratodon purpureus]